MKYTLPLLTIALVLLLNACASSRKMEVVDIEFRDLDTLFVEAEKPNELKSAADFRLPPYNPAAPRINDILHTSLDLRFDWSEETVIGRAELTVTPHFRPVSILILDAKDFEIRSVSQAGQELTYVYDGYSLEIDLGRSYTRTDTFRVAIEYSAQPAASGGSSAITSNQGLFFINADGTKDKPQQIWTQGETEWNSRWFPTIDKPNERFTQEIRLTVEDRFTTLSNGLLRSSEENEDGTRTDIWLLDQPHAPYLAMIAVGEFAKVEDEWRGMPVDYYVEPEYVASAKYIFNHTPEMLDFFSSMLDYDYPWPKYAQVVVRDYVSGAMENTTAVVFGDFVQKHKNELIDNHNDKIVAHELIHHWFGDLVTCESWANLTMNEGFANYAEYLWLEYKYGPDEAEYHLLGERNNYLLSAGLDMHPLIHFGHKDKENMFDAHSYNKGGAVLHMLRRYLGDEVFWASLNRYLRENAYTAVEAHDLRLACEAVSGEDLNWFFDQWYFSQGHPELEIDYSYDAEAGEAVITVEQTQDPDRMPAIFQLPTAIDLYVGGQRERKEVWVKQRIQTFRFPVPQKPDLMVFDPEYTILGFQDFERTEQEYAFQFRNGKHFMDRLQSLEGLEALESPGLEQLLPLALEDDYWYIRNWAVNHLPEQLSPELSEKVSKLLATDPHSQVRAAALEVLDRSGAPGLLELTAQIISQDSAYNVIGSAVKVLYTLDREKALEEIKVLEDTDSDALRGAIARIYGESEDVKYLPFFARNLEKVNGYAVSSFYRYYQELAALAPAQEAMQAMKRLVSIALEQTQSPWRRLAATSSITDMANEWQARANRASDEEKKAALNARVDILKKDLDTIKRTEENDQLRSFYRQMVVIERR